MIEKTQNRCCRNRQQHTPETEHASQHNAGDQDQQAGDAERVGKQSRFENIGVKELQECTEHEEQKRMGRINQQQNKTADCGVKYAVFYNYKYKNWKTVLTKQK